MEDIDSHTHTLSHTVNVTCTSTHSHIHTLMHCCTHSNMWIFAQGQAFSLGHGVGLPRFMAAVQHRCLDALERRTVLHSSSEVFLSKQLWYEPGVEKVWWDLDRLFDAEVQGCKRREKKNHWLKTFNGRVALDIQIRDGDLPFQVFKAHEIRPVPLEFGRANLVLTTK